MSLAVHATETVAPRCPYCGRNALLVSGRTVYPTRADLARHVFWQCHPCDARVGCHPGTTTPLGVLADGNLRAARQAAHAAFDPLWQTGRMRRSTAYARLARALNIAGDRCHIGGFDYETCLRVVSLCREPVMRRPNAAPGGKP